MSFLCAICKKIEKYSILIFLTNEYLSIYPALMGSNTPTSKFYESKEVKWEIHCP